MSIKDAPVWELLEDYADIRDELDDPLRLFEILQFELTNALDDIQDELDNLNTHLEECSSRHWHFKGPASV